MTWRIEQGDCLEVMRSLEEASVDAVVTDPPYGLEFMGKDWDRLGATTEEFREQLNADGRVDYHGKGNAPFGGGGQRVRYGATAKAMQEWHQAWATEALRVLKPGGHLFAFGGTRTYHRLACAVEDAGFEIRDSLVWLYASGFPKSLNVSKAIDKAAGAEREVVGFDSRSKGIKPGANNYGGNGAEYEAGHDLTAPATPEAERWSGWGTALKPAHEPIVLARKPLTGTVAANVAEHGTGALNIDGCRIGSGQGGSRDGEPTAEKVYENGIGGDQKFTMKPGPRGGAAQGRWPANVLLDEEAAAMLDEQSGTLSSNSGEPFVRNSDKARAAYGRFEGRPADGFYGDSGGASRFFYTAKASRAERNAGLEGFEEQKPHDNAGHVHADGRAWDIPGSHSTARANHHPTVKPLALMRRLVRLVTPPGGLVLDPFAGSGTTGCAAVLEGFDFIGIEREPEYVAIAEARIAHWAAHPVQLGLEDAAA